MGVEGVAGMLVAVAVICLGATAWLFFRESWFLQWLRGTIGFLLLGFAFYLSLLAASLFNYQSAPANAPLATLSFEADGAQKWRVTVSEANGNRRVYDLLGDLWQLDVRLLRYSGLASVFGAPASFELERLSGRYLSVEDESSKDHSDFQLLATPFLGFDLWQRATDNGSLIVMPTRSNVALVPAADGAIFEIRLGDKGLDLAPANSAADDALKRVGE
ncbi:MAG: hypothetical protein ACOY33_05110 [Pseudomonadota bacterium]